MDWERLRIGVGNFLSRNVRTQQDDEVTSCLQSKMADYARQVKKFKTRMIRMVKAMIVWSMGLALRSPPLYTPFLMKVSVREFLIWSSRHDLENTQFYSATWVVLESKHRECCCKSESVVVTFRSLTMTKYDLMIHSRAWFSRRRVLLVFRWNWRRCGYGSSQSYLALNCKQGWLAHRHNFLTCVFHIRFRKQTKSTWYAKWPCNAACRWVTLNRTRQRREFW